MTSHDTADHADNTPLPTRQLGATGITVPAIGIGCWAIGGPDNNLGMPMGWSTGADEKNAMTGLETAWQHGARLYDTADVYGHGRSERLLGRLVAQVPRNEIVLASKVGYFAGTAEHGFEPRHMRRQLGQSLDNLRTGHLDIYALHHPDFGTDDRWLHPALDTMHALRDEGLIKAIGMRGPHRFAPDRLTTPPDQRGDKIARFRALFEIAQPDILAIRDNLLTPPDRSEGVFSFADEHNVGILISKPLGQGLLTGTYRTDIQRAFGAGDHRLRKRWFQPDAIEIINAGLDRVRAIVGPHTEDLIRVALWGCLNRSPHAVALVGFTTPGQVAMNLDSLSPRPDVATIAAAREIMANIQARLDAGGETILVPERHVHQRRLGSNGGSQTSFHTCSVPISISRHSRQFQQEHTTKRSTVMGSEQAAKLAVLIDADNAQPTIAEGLLAEVAKYGTAHVKRAYGDWTGTNLKGWKDQLLAQSIQPMQQFAYTTGKNSTDAAMVIDAMDLLHSERFDGFCIVSSDSDFTRLAARLRESGLTVYGFGERKTPKPFVAACDKFVYTENLTQAADATTKPAPRASTVQLKGDTALINHIRNAIEAASDDDGWASLASIGNIITKQRPDFDARTYGYAKLSDLLAATTLFEMDSRSPGNGKPGVIYARDKRRRQEIRPKPDPTSE